MPEKAAEKILLNNGDKLVFNTKPPITATVIGVQDDGYAILWAESGTVQDVEVRKLTNELLEEGLTGGLISLPKAKPTKASSDPKAAAPRPPWAK